MTHYAHQHGSGVAYSSPEDAFKDLETIPAFFPKQVNPTLNDGELVVNGRAILHRQILFKAGINQVPEKLLGHWWLKAQGVTPHLPTAA
jgi:hypothetical protein